MLAFPDSGRAKKPDAGSHVAVLKFETIGTEVGDSLERDQGAHRREQEEGKMRERGGGRRERR